MGAVRSRSAAAARRVTAPTGSRRSHYACCVAPLLGPPAADRSCPAPPLCSPQKLRSLLARCPEWADDTARMRLADELDASPASSTDAGGGRLTSCLRGTDTSVWPGGPARACRAGSDANANLGSGCTAQG